MILLLAIIFFILGLIIGSFLNVVILRFNTSKSLGGRSGCMSCLHKLSWYELIPVFSFLGLGGRCKSCKTKISIQYPLVELASGFIFLALFLNFYNASTANSAIPYSFSWFNPTFIITYIYYAVIFALCLIIAVYDIRHKIIPDRLVLSLGVLAFIGLFFFNTNGSLMFHPHVPSYLDFASGFLIAFPFAFFWLVSSGRWMGLGDAKLAISLGWLFGFYRALSGIVLAFWIGAIVGVMLIIFSKKYGMKSEIPFAPYLVLGMFLVFVFGLSFFPAFIF